LQQVRIRPYSRSVQNVNCDLAYSHVRERILTGEYEPGAVLNAESLSAEIGVSRTPVRDALHKLESDGLVVIRPRTGASVRQMDVPELRDMCDVRLALESQAASKAAVLRTRFELQDIKAALDAMRVLTEKSGISDEDADLLHALFDHDVRFHILIINAAKNELMKKEILRLHLITRIASTRAINRTYMPNSAERDARRRFVLKMHEQIYTAIAEADSEAARKAMVVHIEDAFAHSVGGGHIQKLSPEELLYEPQR
jgi:DNA-binding GntR family transcriptional regulator